MHVTMYVLDADARRPKVHQPTRAKWPWLRTKIALESCKHATGHPTAHTALECGGKAQGVIYIRTVSQ